MIYQITPIPEPRMVRSDSWSHRPCVMQYRAFCDHCRALKATVKSGDHVIFYLSMPESWSGRKMMRMNGTPHTSKPDTDNLLKALLDAFHENDSHIWDVRASKVWARRGAIEIVSGETLTVPRIIEPFHVL